MHAWCALRECKSHVNVACNSELNYTPQVGRTVGVVRLLSCYVQFNAEWNGSNEAHEGCLFLAAYLFVSSNSVLRFLRIAPSRYWSSGYSLPCYSAVVAFSMHQMIREPHEHTRYRWLNDRYLSPCCIHWNDSGSTRTCTILRFPFQSLFRRTKCTNICSLKFWVSPSS